MPHTDHADSHRHQVSFGPFRFDPVNRVLIREGKELFLPPRVLGVLECLLDHAGAIVSKQTLIEAAWKDACVSDASVAEAISTLRETLGDHPQRPTCIQTVHRRGYRFVAPIVTLLPSHARSAPAMSEPPATCAHTPDAHAVRASTSARRHDRFWLLPWIVTAFSLLTAAAASWQAARAGSHPPQPTVRLTLPLPGDDYLPVHGSAVAVSPDGTHVVYAAMREQRRQLFVRAMDRLEAQPVTGTEDGSAPFFSPDGDWIGFYAGGKLRKVALAGGRPIDLADTRTAFGGSWTTDGAIVFSRNGGLARVQDAGGPVEVVADPAPGTGEFAFLWPEVLPGSQAVLFSVQAPGPARIAVASLVSKEKRDLITGGSFARYSPTGHLIFARGGELMAVAFDPVRMEVTSPPMPILDGVATNWYDGSAFFAFSRTGALVYVPGDREPAAKRIALINADGERLLPAPPRPYTSLALSPDGRRAALTVSDDGGSDIWISDLERGTLTPLSHEGSNLEPIWTPRGDRVTFASGGSGPFNLFWTSIGDDRPPERLLSSPNHQFPGSWSPDGRTLAFTEIDGATHADIRLLSADARAASRPFIATPWDETGASFSPDGRWLAYQSNESGRWDVYLAAYPGAGRKMAVSTNGGRVAMWSPDGQRLYYRSDEALMAVGVTGGAGQDVDVSRPVPIVAADAADGPLIVGNGGVFKITDAGARPPSRQFTVVLNWFDEIDRLVPQPLPRVIR